MSDSSRSLDREELPELLPEFRVLICGDRNWTYREMIRRQLVVLGKRIVSPIVVVHGAARGADTLAGEEAAALGYRVEAFPADWETHGKRAGPIRNLQMLDTKPDEVWAFHDDISQSKGTKHTYNEARKRGIPTMLYAHSRSATSETPSSRKSRKSSDGSSRKEKKN